MDDPHTIGEVCTRLNDELDGKDTCEQGAICWNVPEGENDGACRGFCQGSPNDPSCEDQAATCAIADDGVLPLCLDHCDPLAQACGEGQLCAPLGGGFVCVIDASGGDGLYETPCAFINECNPGLLCVSGDVLPDCDPDDCCTPYCDLNEADSCPDQNHGMACVPFYEEGQAPNGLEDVGVCAIPA